ncbi:hypothetical protein BDK51DRAFT_28069, partial [Blyttiomyces helicus]
ERVEAAKTFSGEAGTQLAASLSASRSNAKTFEVGDAPKTAPKPFQAPSAAEAAQIREAIRNASTLEEIARLERQLKGGHVPPGEKGSGAADKGNGKANGEEGMEMDEDEEMDG